jgi:hypothetical protein
MVGLHMQTQAGQSGLSRMGVLATVLSNARGRNFDRGGQRITRLENEEMSNRVRRFLIGAAATSLVLCGASAQAYDAEFDYNADGAVDTVDLELIKAAFNSAEGDTAFNPIFDHDGDGFVGGSDIALAQSAASGE